MPYLCGPNNSRYSYTGSPCPHLDLALKSDARTLGGAVAEYETHFNVQIAPMLEPFDGDPHNAGKYFKFTDMSTGVQKLVDIHISRNSEDICLKQDLSFALLPEDIVELGELIC